MSTLLTLEEVNDFSRLEAAIVDLLKAAVAGLTPAVQVLTAADLASVKEAAQYTPALHVISDGFTPQSEADPRLLRLAHRFYVIAAVRNVATQKSGRAARRDAGPLLARAMAALLGEKLPGTTRPLAAMRAPGGEYRAGFFYLPSAWQAETVFRKPQS
ncbi:hypothetical protein [Comamonas sp. NLF-1-9]|uniref:phage tail terminator protein n=1 Tax=Comamonas sp. NLF-1-9 TaxID=2853163 RepID=UPI001C4798BF|nr:hypothetical protein [Comamonas sp. NLF-1-9]QXL84095.1 hypothetical protein KUD94_12775 [Comamonas sp. NLF-1-9]